MDHHRSSPYYLISYVPSMGAAAIICGLSVCALQISVQCCRKRRYVLHEEVSSNARIREESTFMSFIDLLNSCEGTCMPACFELILHVMRCMLKMFPFCCRQWRRQCWGQPLYCVNLLHRSRGTAAPWFPLCHLKVRWGWYRVPTASTCALELCWPNTTTTLTCLGRSLCMLWSIMAALVCTERHPCISCITLSWLWLEIGEKLAAWHKSVWGNLHRHYPICCHFFHICSSISTQNLFVATDFHTEAHYCTALLQTVIMGTCSLQLIDDGSSNHPGSQLKACLIKVERYNANKKYPSCFQDQADPLPQGHKSVYETTWDTLAHISP